jgi:pSer/pThr/pTyr-binding forkhead associated (FHA) protein
VQRTGEVLAIRDGEILGRREGSYAKKLNSLSQYISSKHAQLAYVAGMWLVTDLKSANGTLINKVECVANQATPIRIGDSLELGDLVLEVIG